MILDALKIVKSYYTLRNQFENDEKTPWIVLSIFRNAHSPTVSKNEISVFTSINWNGTGLTSKKNTNKKTNFIIRIICPIQGFYYWNFFYEKFRWRSVKITFQKFKNLQFKITKNNFKNLHHFFGTAKIGLIDWLIDWLLDVTPT